MRFLKALRLASLGLWGNRVRVSFAMLGVVIGVVSIMILVSIGTGVEKTVSKQLGSLGAEQILVVPGRVLKTSDGQPDLLGAMTNSSSTLTYADAKEIMKQPSVKYAAPHLETVLRASYNKRYVDGIATGVTSHYKQALNLQLSSGRFVTAGDEKEKRRVVVLGSEVEQRLLGVKSKATEAKEQLGLWDRIQRKVKHEVKEWILGSEVSAAANENTLVGKDISIKGETFRVVGILRSQEAIGSNVNNALMMPISTALETTNMKHLSKIYVQATSKDAIDKAQKEIVKAVRKRHSEVDFSVVKQTEMLQVTGKITNVLKLMTVGIAGMAFLIGGIGIMNVMIMSVRERTREIGVRKTLGAGTRDILYQFFLETFLLTIIGGMIGIIIGLIVIELWNGSIGAFPLILPMWAIELAIGSSLITGTIFGIYPAFKAARLQPSHALRYGE